MNKYTKLDKCQVSAFFYSSIYFFTNISYNVIFMPEVMKYNNKNTNKRSKASHGTSAHDGNKANPLNNKKNPLACLSSSQ